MELRVECMESVIAPNAVIKAAYDFVRGIIAGLG